MATGTIRDARGYKVGEISESGNVTNARGYKVGEVNNWNKLDGDKQDKPTEGGGLPVAESIALIHAGYHYFFRAMAFGATLAYFLRYPAIIGSIIFCYFLIFSTIPQGLFITLAIVFPMILINAIFVQVCDRNTRLLGIRKFGLRGDYTRLDFQVSKLYGGDGDELKKLRQEIKESLGKTPKWVKVCTLLSFLVLFLGVFAVGVLNDETIMNNLGWKVSEHYGSVAMVSVWAVWVMLLDLIYIPYFFGKAGVQERKDLKRKKEGNIDSAQTLNNGDTPSQQILDAKSEINIENGELVFAHWNDGQDYYYPANIDKQSKNKIVANFLDGHSGEISVLQVIKLSDIYNVFSFEGNWENRGTYYPCSITKKQPLTVKYHQDGVVEKIEISQLRGYIPTNNNNADYHVPSSALCPSCGSSNIRASDRRCNDCSAYVGYRS